MTLIVPIYLSYYVLIVCCMPTYTCTHAKLSRTSLFLGQILNLKTSFFYLDGGSMSLLCSAMQADNLSNL
jgi:hypothetical protein